MFLRIVEGKARPGKVQDIENLWIQYAEAVVKKAKGFLFVQTLDSGDNVMAVSSWRTREDMEAYLELEEARALYCLHRQHYVSFGTTLLLFFVKTAGSSIRSCPDIQDKTKLGL